MTNDGRIHDDDDDDGDGNDDSYEGAQAPRWVAVICAANWNWSSQLAMFAWISSLAAIGPVMVAATR